jgi:hypothetical protein
MPSVWFTSSILSPRSTTPHRPCPQRIWQLYADLKAYRRAPHPASQAARRRGSKPSSREKPASSLPTGLLARLHANKSELLKALARREIPLHTNGSENDTRCQVTRLKISRRYAAIAAGTAAMPSSPSPKPAGSLQSRPGTIWVAGSPSQAPNHSQTRHLSMPRHPVTLHRTPVMAQGRTLAKGLSQPSSASHWPGLRQ